MVVEVPADLDVAHVAPEGRPRVLDGPEVLTVLSAVADKGHGVVKVVRVALLVLIDTTVGEKRTCAG